MVCGGRVDTLAMNLPILWFIQVFSQISLFILFLCSYGGVLSKYVPQPPPPPPLPSTFMAAEDNELLCSTSLSDCSRKRLLFQSMDEFNEKYALIPPKSVVILDWPSVDKEHKGFSKLVQLLDDHPVGFSVRQGL